MPINPFWTLGGGSAGGTAGMTMGMPATAGAATAGLPWSIILPIALSLMGSMFSKEKDPYEEAMQLKNQMAMLGFKPPYQSRYASTIDPVVAQALLAQLKRTANWGWPAGMGMDTSFIEDALANVGMGGGVRRKQLGGVIGG